jgi:hypothetical protein
MISSPPVRPPRRRRLWPWLLAILLTPVILLAAAAASYLTLNRDATILRGEVMAATDARWQTRFQFSVGRLTLWAVRTGLACVPGKHIHEARAALQAIKSVSIGVYYLEGSTTRWSRENLFQATDHKMQVRGWFRLVGVAGQREQVLIYMPAADDNPRRLCLAVIKGRELVVVSASVDPDCLADFVAAHAAGSLRPKLANLRICSAGTNAATLRRAPVVPAAQRQQD